jgi:hypothetical protein
MLIAASAILLVLGVLAYRRALIGQVTSTKDKGQSKSRKAEVADIGLLALRLVILLLFAAVFIGAVFTHVWTERPRRVAVMLDVSESMSAVGAESAAAAVAEAFPLPEGAKRDEWAFADTAVRAEVQSPESRVQSRPDGGRTRIGAALKAVGKTRPGAVVLLSDGQDNGQVDAVATARDIGVPVYAVGFGGLAKRNASVEQVLLPAVVYSGDTVDVQVRVAGAGFADEKARVRLRGETREVVLGQAMAEQDVPFRMVFNRSGRQVIEARLDSLIGESNYADNTRSVTVDVRLGRLRVAYVTNRPGPGTRILLRALGSDERIQVDTVISVSGALSDERGALNAGRADVFILDNVVETGSPEVWQSIADGVRAGAGALVLAGSDFQPGQSVGKVLNGTVDRQQTGTFTPELTAEGGVLPWFSRDAIDLASVPPFNGSRPLAGLNPIANPKSPIAKGMAVWLVAQENKMPLMLAGKAGKGRVVYVAAYPLWRWGFGPEEKPEQGTPLSAFVAGVVRYLAERDTSPFWLEADRPELYRGQPVRLVMRAVAPDGTPWSGLDVMVQVVRDTMDTFVRPESEVRRQNAEGRSRAQKAVTVPMTENGAGVYEATVEALGPGRYRAVATVEKARDQGIEGSRDQVGRATTEFAVAEQALELASTGMNEATLRAISEASGGRFFISDSIPRDGATITLGSYQRRFVFDPRRAVWAYVLIALLAGAEWLMRRRRGML